MKTILTVCFLSLLTLEGRSQSEKLPVPRHKFTVISHRGDHLVYPENTLEAYKKAIQDGADYIEIDLRTTRDGELISLHDVTVDRMTNTKGPLKDLSLDQARGLTIRSKDSSDKNIYRIPTFEEILKLCKDKIYIYIDFKEASAAQTYALLKKYGMERQVLVYINKEEQIKDWRSVDSSIPLMLSLPDNVHDAEGLKHFAAISGVDVLDGSWDDYSRELVLAARTLHLLAWPDVQSSREGIADWDKALALGFTGLQTDHPEALIRYLEQKGYR